MRKLLLLPIALSVVGSGIILAMSVKQDVKGEFDLPGLNQQIQRHDEQLGNHEARITNSENDVADIQDNTSTPPRPTRQDVPSVTTQPAQPVSSTTPATPAPTPEPEPVVVTAYEEIPVPDSEDVDCKLTYSDGTYKQWHWKTVEYNQGTKITRTSGRCDSSVIGQPK